MRIVMTYHPYTVVPGIVTALRCAGQRRGPGHRKRNHQGRPQAPAGKYHKTCEEYGHHPRAVVQAYIGAVRFQPYHKAGDTQHDKHQRHGIDGQTPGQTEHLAAVDFPYRPEKRNPRLIVFGSLQPYFPENIIRTRRHIQERAPRHHYRIAAASHV